MKPNLSLSLLAAAFISAGPAMAHGSLDGANLLVEFGYGDDATSFSDFTLLKSYTSATITVGTGTELNQFKLNNSGSVAWQLDLGGNHINLSYIGSAEFMYDETYAFYGFRIRDTSDSLAPIEDVALANTSYVSGSYGNLIETTLSSGVYGPLPQRYISFDDSGVYINLTNSMWHNTDPHPPAMGDKYRNAVSLNVHVAAVPEPASWGLAAIGLAALRWTARRRPSGQRA